MFEELERELARLQSAFGAALDRASRDLAEAAARRVPRRPRDSPVPTRVPFPRVRRPVAHPLFVPRPPRLGLPPHLPDRQPPGLPRRPGAPSPFAAAVEAGAARLAARLRQRLLDVQSALRGLSQRLGTRVRRNR
jgi:hypothetical protein